MLNLQFSPAITDVMAIFQRFLDEDLYYVCRLKLDDLILNPDWSQNVVLFKERRGGNRRGQLSELVNLNGI